MIRMVLGVMSSKVTEYAQILNYLVTKYERYLYSQFNGNFIRAIVNYYNKEKKNCYIVITLCMNFLQDRIMYKNYRPGGGESEKHPEG